MSPTQEVLNYSKHCFLEETKGEGEEMQQVIFLHKEIHTQLIALRREDKEMKTEKEEVKISQDMKSPFINSMDETCH